MSTPMPSKVALALGLFLGVGVGILAWEHLRPAVIPQAESPEATPAAAADPEPKAPGPMARNEHQTSVTAASAEKPGPGRQPGVTRDDARRELENRLLSEPVSPSWAGYQKDRIASLLSAESLVPAGAGVPLYHSVDCRSTLCRVDLVTRTSEEMDVTELHVLEGISETLGSAHLFHEPQPDGSMALVIYAQANEP